MIARGKTRASEASTVVAPGNEAIYRSAERTGPVRFGG